MILQGVQLVIPAMLSQQFLVGTLLQNLPVRQHDDVVGVLDRGGGVVGQPPAWCPPLRIFSSESWISSSVSVSMLAVASSKIITLGLWMMVRAKLSSCRWPAEKLLPRSRTPSSRPWSSFVDEPVRR